MSGGVVLVLAAESEVLWVLARSHPSNDFVRNVRKEVVLAALVRHRQVLVVRLII